jgi:hypothetical protein
LIGKSSRWLRRQRLCPNFKFLADPLLEGTFEWASLVIIAMQVEIVAYVIRRSPQRLPVSIVRRAL